jgi:hypothetical protein
MLSSRASSGQRLGHSPDPDWIATIQALIQAGASTQDITLSPNDPKPPSPDVAELLRGHRASNGHQDSPQ